MLAETDTGETVVLHSDGTWTFRRDHVPEELEGLVEIDVLRCGMIDTSLYGPMPGYRLRIKNASELTITRLRLRVLFLDANGAPFFEDYILPISSNPYSMSDSPDLFKPNYSFVYPANDRVTTVDNLDVDSWEVGSIRVEVAEAEIEP